MESNTSEQNLVIYLMAKSLKTKGYPEFHFAGGHGYSYTISNEGKKKLAKDVATTTGYYTGNNQRANTVVVVDDIVNLTTPNAGSLFQAVIRSFGAILDLYLQPDGPYKNLCLITPHKELQEVYKLNKNNISTSTRINRIELSEGDVEVLKEILITVDRFKDTTSKIVFDFPGSVEGGAGNKLAYKQMEIAEVISNWGTDKEVEISIIPRKEYETPETDFNKIVSATRWYFQNIKEEEFFDTHHGYRKYGFGKVEPDKNYYGKLTPDVTYSTLYTKNPITLLDKLFKFTNRKVDNPNGYLLAGDLNHLTSKEVARMIDTHPAIREGNNLVSPVTKGNSKPVLIEIIQPVLMSYRIREDLASMDVILDAFMARDENNVFNYSTFYDITSLIYTKEKNKKDVVKLKLHPDFNQNKSTFTVAVKHPSAVKDVGILLSVGYDIPERNAFNSVEDPEVKVWVATDTRNTKGIRFCTLVETTDWIYIHTSAAANLKVLSLADLGKSK